MKPTIKALFLDIDGTLLSFTTHKIPQSAIKAIRLAQKKGVKVIIATGRAMPLITVLDELKPDGYITTNGCCCFNAQKEIIYQAPIPLKDKQNLIAYLKEEKDALPMAFCTKKSVFLNKKTALVEQIGEMLNLHTFPIESLEKALQEDVLEIIAYMNKEEEETIISPLMPNCEFPRWHPLFSDIIAKGHNKQTGISQMLSYLAIPQTQTMAIGDGGNDIEMLQYVAVGVAMGNATDFVKQQADDVTAHVDEDGLALAINKYIL